MLFKILLSIQLVLKIIKEPHHIIVSDFYHSIRFLLFNFPRDSFYFPKNKKQSYFKKENPKKKWLIIFVAWFLTDFSCIGQNVWFERYQDSISSVKAAEIIKNQFVEDVNKVFPELNLRLDVVQQTTPLLIYYQNKTAYFPLWKQLPNVLKDWLHTIGGNEIEGQDIFRLFFNGFYLPHELAHGFEDAIGTLGQFYHHEKIANSIALLWLRKHGYHQELEMCYQKAKEILTKLPDPVPNGISTENFFTDNYYQILLDGDPGVYGFMQFTQFVSVYEDDTLPTFEAFIKEIGNTTE